MKSAVLMLDPDWHSLWLLGE